MNNEESGMLVGADLPSWSPPFSAELECESSGKRFRVRIEGQSNTQVLEDAINALDNLASYG